MCDLISLSKQQYLYGLVESRSSSRLSYQNTMYRLCRALRLWSYRKYVNKSNHRTLHVSFRTEHWTIGVGYSVKYLYVTSRHCLCSYNSRCMYYICPMCVAQSDS